MTIEQSPQAGIEHERKASGLVSLSRFPKFSCVIHNGSVGAM